MIVESLPTEAAPVKEPGGDGGPEAGLVVDEVRIRGFRSLVDVKVRLEPTNTYLVGENNSGKSSLLLAIATACGNRRATIEDLHQGRDGQTMEEGEIDLLIRSRDDEFQEGVGQRLGPNAASGPGRGEWTGIRTTLRPSKEGPFLHTRRIFLQWDPAGQDWIDTRNGVSEKVLELITSQLLDASRDLETEIPNRTSDWGKVLTNLAVEDDDRRKLEGDLLQLGEELHGASPVFGTLRTQLSKIAQAQAGVDAVTLQALPVRLEELAKAVEVMVASGGRKGLPLRYQGLGSRSLAALMVFQALCELRVGVDLGIRPHILTLLEEPEAHLHPQAQAGIARILRALPGQAIVATHSQVIVAEADPGAVRIFRADDPGAVVNALSRKSAKKIAVFRRYVERPLGELFFARLVVFVDGTAERISIPVMLEPLLGMDPAGAGVSFVELEGMTQERLNKAVEALEELGPVRWLVFVDNDGPGFRTIEGLEGSDGRKLTPTHDQVVVSGRKQLEQLLLDAGYHAETEEIANTYAPRDPRDPDFEDPRLPSISDEGAEDLYLRFLADNKGWASELVARLAVERGRTMPGPVVELASKLRAALGLEEPTGERYEAARGPVAGEPGQEEE